MYISAPAGTGADYPSYYGGAYLTTRGSFDYWQVSDAEDPSFEVCINPGSEPGAWGEEAPASQIEILKLSKKYSFQQGGTSHESDEQGLIKISNISAEIMGKTNYINLHYWGSEGCPVDEGVVTYKIDGDKLYYVDPDEGIIKIQAGIKKLEKGTYSLYIGGSAKETINGVEDVTVGVNKKGDLVPYIEFSKLFEYDKLRNLSASKVERTVSSFVEKTNNTGAPITYLGTNGQNATAQPGAKYVEKVETEVSVATGEFVPIKIDGERVIASQDEIISYIKETVLSGLSAKTLFVTPDTNEALLEAEPFSGITSSNRFEYRVNIKDITFCRIHQKSPNEVPTVVEISNIGYDKWQYDQQVAWVNIADLKNGSKILKDDALVAVDNVTKENIAQINLPEVVINTIMSTNVNGLVMVYNESASESKRRSIYKVDVTTGRLEDVTSMYLTQRFYVNYAIYYNTLDKAWTTTTNDDSFGGLVYTIWEIATASTKPFAHTSYQCTETSKVYPLKKNAAYNSLTVSCKEIVYPGEYTSGGEFTGSLSETGTDSFGSNIYWPNILPEETVTFIEVVPVNTFDKVKGPENMEAINDQGFFIGNKIVDPIGPAQDLYSNYLKGQRYCTHINEDNQKNGLLGCTWRDEYFPIIKDGLIEAQSPDYDDALIFMEPSGYEEYKPLLMSLRVKYHDTSTIISPKIITKAELMNPRTITVSGRSKGTAQYIGEFKKYDTYTGKNYFCQPIGDVGLQLARIMDKKMGGIAPAGTNDSAGLGGCLARPVLSAKWKFSDDALKILDEKGLCAITYDADNGLMIQSQKSTQDPSMVTDWSYLGHSMSFDLCKREIRDKVMVQQVFKRINQYWMDIRTKQVQAILDKRTTGTDPIWAMAHVDITGQNTPTTMAKRQFVIKVTCKVYVYSETVLLIFENLSQE